MSRVLQVLVVTWVFVLGVLAGILTERLLFDASRQALLSRLDRIVAEQRKHLMDLERGMDGLAPEGECSTVRLVPRHGLTP